MEIKELFYNQLYLNQNQDVSELPTVFTTTLPALLAGTIEYADGISAQG